MTTLFVLLFGMLVAGAGVALGIMAYDRAHDARTLPARCRVEE